MMRIAVAIGSAWLLTACSHGSSESSASGDIAKIAEVKSDFGPDFKVKETPKTGIDPKVLLPHKLPPGLSFDPPNCEEFVTGEDMPSGLQANMAAVAAEGDGGRFITMAVQTSQPVPFKEPAGNCKRVIFRGGRIHGLIEIVDVPMIDGTRTLGVHRVLQTVVQGKPRSGELYNYSAHFGDCQVIVTANPMVVQGQEPKPVDTKRARDLLVKSVAAVKN